MWPATSGSLGFLHPRHPSPHPLTPNASLAEIYRIVSQKQITDSGETERPGGSQAITLQPTQTEEGGGKKPCCN